MFTNEKYIKFTAPSGRRFFLRASQVISVKVISATRVNVIYAQAEQGAQGWNISLTTAADINAVAADLTEQIIALQATPYTESVGDFSPNGYTITGQ